MTDGTTITGNPTTDHEQDGDDGGKGCPECGESYNRAEVPATHVAVLMAEMSDHHCVQKRKPDTGNKLRPTHRTIYYHDE